MSKKLVSAKHVTSCSDAELFDEITHKIDDNILSVKLPKDKHRVEKRIVDKEAAKLAEPIIDVNCFDKYGER